MSGDLQPTSGDIRPHGHLKMGRFTQHFVDVLDLEMTPLEFFESQYPEDPRDEVRKILGRFGLSGARQIQKMAELSDGQKSRVVFAKLGRDVPHILLMDGTYLQNCQMLTVFNHAFLYCSRLTIYLSFLTIEPTNHLDMESIDALALAINEFKGGMVLVSHDMRLIGQVAREIWICDDKTITKHTGGIQSFKMDMRAQMGIDGDQNGASSKALKGDASVKKKKETAKPPAPKKPEPKLEVITPPAPAPVAPAAVELPSRFAALAPSPAPSSKAPEAEMAALKVASTPSPATTAAKGSSYVPLHLRG
jgi:ATP-binding cassette subfamily F protein 2